MARSVRDGSRRDTALFVLCILLAIVARALPDPIRDPIAGVLRQTLVAPLLHLQASAERTRSAWLNYENLTVSRDSIALHAMQIHTLESENERLRDLLAFGSRLGWGFTPAEALHGQTIGEETTVTLSVGSDAGVKRYAPVVAPEGLVGVIQSVDPTTSVALLWGHPQFRPSAMSADGSAFGIIYPHASEGAERFLLELRGVQFRSPLDTGSLIVTSGWGGVFPTGIPIGTVVGEIKTTELWARTYLLRPAVPPPEVRSVMVINQQKGTSTGTQRVWTLPRADSAARAIARAGDSLVRRDLAAAAAKAAAAGPTTAPVTAPASGTNPTTPAATTPRPSTTQAPVRRTETAAPRTSDTTAIRPPVAQPPAARPDSVVQSPPVAVPPPITVPIQAPPPVIPPVTPPPTPPPTPGAAS